MGSGSEKFVHEMETEENASIYLNEEICQLEKDSTGWYIMAVGIMEFLSLYLLFNLSCALYFKPTAQILQGSKAALYGKFLHGLLFVVIVTIVCRVTLDLLQLSLGKIAYRVFGIIFISKAAFSTISYGCVYTFLWLRQWILYGQPILRHVKTPVFKFFNILVLILTTSLVAVSPGK